MIYLCDTCRTDGNLINDKYIIRPFMGTFDNCFLCDKSFIWNDVVEVGDKKDILTQEKRNRKINILSND